MPVNKPSEAQALLKIQEILIGIFKETDEHLNDILKKAPEEMQNRLEKLGRNVQKDIMFAFMSVNKSKDMSKEMKQALGNLESLAKRFDAVMQPLYQDNKVTAEHLKDASQKIKRVTQDVQNHSTYRPGK